MNLVLIKNIYIGIPMAALICYLFLLFCFLFLFFFSAQAHLFQISVKQNALAQL